MSDRSNVSATEQRKTILLLEAAALLHDIGKLSDGFLQSRASDKEQYPPYAYDLRVDPRKAFLDPHDANHPSLAKLLSNANTVGQQQAGDGRVKSAPFADRPAITQELAAHTFTAWDGRQYNVSEIVLLEAPRYVDIDWQAIRARTMDPAKLIGSIHGVAHYEKQVDRKGTQPAKSVFISTAFGFEREIRIGDQMWGPHRGLAPTPLGRYRQHMSHQRWHTSK